MSAVEYEFYSRIKNKQNWKEFLKKAVERQKIYKNNFNIGFFLFFFGKWEKCRSRCEPTSQMIDELKRHFSKNFSLGIFPLLRYTLTVTRVLYRHEFFDLCYLFLHISIKKKIEKRDGKWIFMALTIVRGSQFQKLKKKENITRGLRNNFMIYRLK